MKAKEILKIAAVPLILLGFYLLVTLLWKTLNLPAENELIELIQSFFGRYGLWVVFTGAFIEGFLLLGQYFPGGTIIFLGVISAGSDPMRAAIIVLVVSIAFILSYTANYLIGKYGWYKLFLKFGLKTSLEKAKQKLTMHGASTVVVSYWEPNLASITATAAGVLQIPSRQFQLYSIIGVFAWNAFWGTLVFLLGANALKLIGLKYIVIIFGIWIIVVVAKHYIIEKRKKKLS